MPNDEETIRAAERLAAKLGQGPSPEDAEAVSSLVELAKRLRDLESSHRSLCDQYAADAAKAKAIGSAMKGAAKFEKVFLAGETPAMVASLTFVAVGTKEVERLEEALR